MAPRERELFRLLEDAATNAVRAADLLDELIHHYPDRTGLSRELVICEQEGDRITQEVYRRLNETFVTPIDREDIHALATALDDIVDLCEEAGELLIVYGAKQGRPEARRLTKVLLDSSRQVETAIGKLGGGDDLSRPLSEIARLEREGDRLNREALTALFAESDTLEVVRWKDIIERLESAVDATKHVADVLAAIDGKR
jgi:predicted phosphate transport protein (TIGR00153 family)